MFSRITTLPYFPTTKIEHSLDPDEERWAWWQHNGDRSLGVHSVKCGCWSWGMGVTPLPRLMFPWGHVTKQRLFILADQGSHSSLSADF